MSKWIPGWAKYYTIEENADGNGLHIEFYDSKVWDLTKPISDLAHDLAIADVCQQIREKPIEPKRNKYSREIKPGVWVDVYDVLRAFGVTCGAVAHAIKKLLAPGQRGHKDHRQDIKEARQSLERAEQLIDEWS